MRTTMAFDEDLLAKARVLTWPEGEIRAGGSAATSARRSPAEPLAHDDGLAGILAVNLEHGLRNIRTDHGSVHGGRFLLLPELISGQSGTNDAVEGPSTQHREPQAKRSTAMSRPCIRISPRSDRGTVAGLSRPAGRSPIPLVEKYYVTSAQIARHNGKSCCPDR